MVADKCFVCQNQLNAATTDQRIGVGHYDCPACGTYSLTIQGLDAIRDMKPEGRTVLSGSLRWRSLNGASGALDGKAISDLSDASHVPNGPIEAADLILLYIQRKTAFFGDEVIMHYMDLAVAYSRNIKEFENYILLSDELGYTKTDWGQGGAFTSCLTAKGWNRLDQMRGSARKTDAAFAAMWFDPSMLSAWTDGILPALKQTGYKGVRIDRVEHNDKIDDRIVAEIRKSSLLVADFTGNRGGVYFEAGLAMGLGIPVVWTCRSDHIADVHFDTRQYNHIVWTNPGELREALIRRIEATFPLSRSKSGAF